MPRVIPKTEEPLSLDGKAGEASHCHVKSVLPDGGHTIEEELQRGA